MAKCRYCMNAYVDWKTNTAKCIKLEKQIEKSKGECKYFESDKKVKAV